MKIKNEKKNTMANIPNNKNSYNKKIDKINNKIKKIQKKSIESSNKPKEKKKFKFDKNIKRNLIILSCIMIFIHILGLIYQIVTNQPIKCILFKELFIALFIIQIVLLKIEFRYTKYICSIFQLCICIISLIYFDFSSVIISGLTIIYILNLNSPIKINDKNINNNPDIKTKTKTKTKK